ncbi:hypothetical protein [Spirillospora sp. NPDC047279]|uniref:hypothetical protein n=1 Tax=Spirillospora sp. NPDC047279 TaxID=3155478 RepID=UPI0033C627B1
MNTPDDDLLAAYDTPVRAVRELPPVGAVIERDGPLSRVHHGTHGRVEHEPFGLDAVDLPSLIRRQQRAFAERGERAECGRSTPTTPSASLLAGRPARGRLHRRPPRKKS